MKDFLYAYFTKYPSTLVFEQEEVCTDSDDGINYYVRGTTVNKEGGVALDYCNSFAGICPSAAGCGGGPFIVEWSCRSDGYFEPSFYKCPNGCNDGACIQEKCAGEGEYASGSVSPENQFGCCAGLTPYNAKPGLDGAGPLCYDNAKGIPLCKYGNTEREGWYYSGAGTLLRLEKCADTAPCYDSDSGVDYYVQGSCKLNAPVGLGMPGTFVETC